jgi:hypothetical protein
MQPNPSPQAPDIIPWGTAIRDIGLITALWCLGNALINPTGNFPLNDDLSYALSVKRLLETGQYFTDYGESGPGFTPVLWGALFCLPAGFSFTALRVATLVAAWLGLAGCYILARELRLPRRGALLLALALGFNADYYGLLLPSFMAGALLTTLLIWAAAFLCRSLHSGGHVQLLAGTALALAATLSWQLAFCIPLAFAACELARSRITPRALLRACAPPIAGAGANVALHQLIPFTALPDVLRGLMVGVVGFVLFDPLFFVQEVLANALLTTMHLGLLLFPVLLISSMAIWRSGTWSTRVWASVPGAPCRRLHAALPARTVANEA